MVFWLSAVALTAVVGGYLLYAVMRAEDSESEAHDIDVYRDQLRDVEKDLARGVLSAEAADATRLEIQRRILSADKTRAQGAKADAAAPMATRVMIVLAGLVLFGGSLALYQKLGAPAYPDMPLKARLAAIEELRQTRPAQALAEERVAGQTSREAEADPEFLALVQQLRDAMKTRPDSLEGFLRLADAEAGLGNYGAAAQAFARVIELKGAAATAVDHRDHGELLILAAGGYVSPEAEHALAEALRRDAQEPGARYYSGLMFAQTGRPDRAFRLWRALLEESAPGDPWVPPIENQIERVAAAAGIPFTLTPKEDPAEGMSAEERNEMIMGMVSGLAERLAEEGGTAEEWARMVRAYGVLGETEKARGAWEDAQKAFAGDADSLAQIRREAEGAGVAE